MSLVALKSTLVLCTILLLSAACIPGKAPVGDEGLVRKAAKCAEAKENALECTQEIAARLSSEEAVYEAYGEDRGISTTRVYTYADDTLEPCQQISLTYPGDPTLEVVVLGPGYPDGCFA